MRHAAWRSPFWTGLVTITFGGLAVPAGEQAQPLSELTPAEGVYTTVQAERGKKQYLINCASCHAEDLNGGRFFHDEPVPALKRPTLFAGWPDLKTYYEAFREAMPADAPMSLTDEEYVDILAYLLAVNGYPAGTRELPVDTAQLQRITLPRGAK